MFKIVMIFILGIVGAPSKVLVSADEYPTKEACITALVSKAPLQMQEVAKHVPNGLKFKGLMNCLKPDEMQNAMAAALIVQHRFQANPDLSEKELLKDPTPEEFNALEQKALPEAPKAPKKFDPKDQDI